MGNVKNPYEMQEKINNKCEDYKAIHEDFKTQIKKDKYRNKLVDKVKDWEKWSNKNFTESKVWFRKQYPKTKFSWTCNNDNIHLKTWKRLLCADLLKLLEVTSLGLGNFSNKTVESEIETDGMKIKTCELTTAAKIREKIGLDATSRVNADCELYQHMYFTQYGKKYKPSVKGHKCNGKNKNKAEKKRDVMKSFLCNNKFRNQHIIDNIVFPNMTTCMNVKNPYEMQEKINNKCEDYKAIHEDFKTQIKKDKYR